MDRAQAQKLVTQLGDELHKAFPEAEAADRLAQLDSHLITVDMLVDHLFDEAERR